MNTSYSFHLPKREMEGGEKSFMMMNSPPSVVSEEEKEIERVFNALTVANQLEMVLQAHGKERLDRLFLSENPQQLVQKLPELEIFLTAKEIGERDALDLISLTTPEQFQYLLDLDLWKKDQLDPPKVLLWMEILHESGEEKVTQFIRSTDPEWITLLLKKFLDVKTFEGEFVEVRDCIPLFTLDQYYFIEFKGKGAREVFQPFLESLYHIDRERYRRWMEALISETESELEETNYRLRNGRLADYGFPDFEEALEIYRFIPPDSLRSGEKIARIMGPEEMEKSRPTFYLTFQKEGPFFSSILSRVDDPMEMNRLKYEMAALCNKALIAEAIDLSNLEEIKQGVRKVYHYLNLSLQSLSRNDENAALGILESVPIQKIFQCGVSITLLLRRKAESLLKDSWFEGDRKNLAFLDPPYLEKMESILKKRPTIYRNGGTEDFERLEDLREAENFLESIEAIANPLGEELGVTPRYLKALNLEGCYPKDWSGITFSTIFLTSLANHVLKGVFQFEAIEKTRLKDLFSRIFERDLAGKGAVKMEIKKGLREWCDSIEGDENRRQHLHAFMDFCLDLLEEEYGKIPPGEEIDPRFVKGLLVRT